MRRVTVQGGPPGASLSSTKSDSYRRASASPDHVSHLLTTLRTGEAGSIASTPTYESHHGHAPERLLRRFTLGVAVCLALARSAGAADARRIEVRAEPEAVVLGGDGPQDVVLTVVITGGDEAFSAADLVLRSTAGSVVDLRQQSARAFTARLARPADTFPQLAVVTAADLSPVAEGKPPNAGSVVVAFSAKIELKGQSEAGARMEVRIAGQRFGPVTADGHGQFVLPVVVPPGEGWAQGVSTDRLGNTSRSKINLYLPEVERVHAFVFPEDVVADGSDPAWVFVTTVSAAGAPEEAPVRAKVERGKLGKVAGLGVGIKRVAYIPPVSLGSGVDVVTLRHGRVEAQSPVQVKLVAGAPARISANPLPPPVPADGKTEVVMQVEVFDGRGNHAAGNALVAEWRGAPAVVAETSAGVFIVKLPPTDKAASEVVSLRVLPQGSGCRRGRLLRSGGVLRVTDRRGIACAGEFTLTNRAGAVVAQGALGQSGVLSAAGALELLKAGGRLDVAQAVPRRVAMAETGTLAPALVSTATVVWRLPTPVELAIFETGRSQGDIALRVDTKGVDEVAKRIQIEASSGRLKVEGAERGALRVVLLQPNLPVEVVATDGPTGVAAWLRVE